jgi:hypothetical protein
MEGACEGLALSARPRARDLGIDPLALVAEGSPEENQ